jgi:predicted NBD/HSP70 family sugar kinase
MTILPSGPLCHCGNTGCLEALASGQAIAASAIKAVRSVGNSVIEDLVEGKIEKITAAIVSEAANMGDKTAKAIICEAATYLGIGLANANMLLSPDLIVIGGGVSKAGDIFIQQIDHTARRRSFSGDGKFPPIRLSLLGDDASGIGAAILVLKELN